MAESELRKGADLMKKLDQLYLAILHRGLVSIRNASRNGDLALCAAESEYLHEIPSLIAETNIHRHVYQATKVRQAFVEWANRNGREDVVEFENSWLASALEQVDGILLVLAEE